MLLIQTLVGISAACSISAESGSAAGWWDKTNSQINDIGSFGSKLTQKSHPFMKQVSDQLKNELTGNIMTCLTNRRNPMRAEDQKSLSKTQWFKDWNTHCGQLIDPACPGRMGECWAMGVLMCRKNCDAKFTLRGNRKKFKRCIYRELKIYEKTHPGAVTETCSVLNPMNN